MQHWKEPLKQINATCLCCGSLQLHLDFETTLYMGFGGWTVTKNGELFYVMDNETEWEDCKKLKDIEAFAVKEPNADWLAICDTPLHGETYQRQNDKWVLIEQNEGFA